MQNFIFCQIFSVLFHPVSFPVLLLPAVPALLPLSTVFLFFPVFRSYPAFFFSCRLFFPSPFFSGLFPSRQFFLFLSFRHPAPFFSLFLQSVSAPLLPDAFFSPGASPPEHNISEHKPKHTDSSFCRPKCRVRQIIKNLPVTTYV